MEPEVAAVPAESGVPLGDACAKPLTDEVIHAADLVVTMGCGDASPVMPDHRSLDWHIPDPDHAPLVVALAIRDQINAHITNLLASLPRPVPRLAKAEH